MFDFEFLFFKHLGKSLFTHLLVMLHLLLLLILTHLWNWLFWWTWGRFLLYWFFNNQRFATLVTPATIWIIFYKFWSWKFSWWWLWFFLFFECHFGLLLYDWRRVKIRNTLLLVVCFLNFLNLLLLSRWFQSLTKSYAKVRAATDLGYFFSIKLTHKLWSWSWKKVSSSQLSYLIISPAVKKTLSCQSGSEITTNRCLNYLTLYSFYSMWC